MALGSEPADGKSEVCPMKDLVGALMESLVDPRLPFMVSSDDAPELSVQQAVAKQMHPVVMLYNYLHRKQHPEAEYLDFVAFCKLAVVLRQTLKAFMKFTNQGEFEDMNDTRGRLSVTEKAIKNACDISVALDSSQESPDTEGWPISKVAVLLIDSAKENCFLKFGSLTEGVWSLIEKELDVSNTNIEISANETMGTKRKRNRRTSTDGKNADDNAFLQLAFDAVKEVAGIDHSDLEVLETHVVYSLNKEKTAAQFYMMQCTQSIIENQRVPIEEVVTSLQGPLVEKTCDSWTSGPVVEYYHMHPYAGIMSHWLSRKGSCLPRLDGSNYQSTKEVIENEILLLPELKSINEDFLNIDKASGGLVEEDNDRNNKKCKHPSSSKEASPANITQRTEKDDTSGDKLNGRCEIVDYVVKEVDRTNRGFLNQNDGNDQSKISPPAPLDKAQGTDMDALPKIDVCALKDGVHEKSSRIYSMEDAHAAYEYNNIGRIIHAERHVPHVVPAVGATKVEECVEGLPETISQSEPVVPLLTGDLPSSSTAATSDLDPFLQSIQGLFSTWEQVKSTPPLCTTCTTSPAPVESDACALRDVMVEYTSFLDLKVHQAASPNQVVKLDRISTTLTRILSSPILEVSADIRVMLHAINNEVNSLIAQSKKLKSRKHNLMQVVGDKEYFFSSMDSIKSTLDDLTADVMIEDSLLISLEAQAREIQRQIMECKARRYTKKLCAIQEVERARTMMSRFQELKQEDTDATMASIMAVDTQLRGDWDSIRRTMRAMLEKLNGLNDRTFSSF